MMLIRHETIICVKHRGCHRITTQEPRFVDKIDFLVESLDAWYAAKTNMVKDVEDEEEVLDRFSLSVDWEGCPHGCC